MKIKDITILLEYNRDITKQKIGDKLSVAGQRDRNVDVDTILQTLEEIDPTPNKQYVLWLANQYMKNLFRLEDKNRVKDVLQKFMQVKSRLPEKDIGRYTFHSLEEKMDELFNVQLSTQTKPTEPEQQTFQVPKGTKVLYNGPLGLLAIPLSYKASCILGSGTKWCTAATDDPEDARETFLSYTEDAPLYIWRDKNGKKYQFYFYTAKDSFDDFSFQFMDSRDIEIPKKMIQYFRTEHPVLKKMFEKEELKMIKTLDYRLSQQSIHTTSELEDEGEFFDYFTSYIKERMPLLEKLLLKHAAFGGVQEFAEKYATKFNLGIWPEMFKRIMQIEPKNAVIWYMDLNPKRERNADIEKYLITKNNDMELLYDYLEDVGPVPELANIFLSSPVSFDDISNAYYYAINIRKKRWPEFEKVLLKKIHQKRLPDWMIENIIEYYVVEVIKKRWPELEEQLDKKSRLWRLYRRMLQSIGQKF